MLMLLITLNVVSFSLKKMKLKDSLSDYVLGDGQIISLKVNLDYQEKSKSRAVVGLIVRRPAEKNLLEKCKIELQFEQVSEVGINEDFGSDYYSDITLLKLDNGLYYLSLDPFGNTGQPHEKDNFVIIAKSLIIEEKG